MKYIISGYKPASLFQYFEKLCAIPHPSGGESKIADFLQAFADEHKLECLRDSVDNIVIKKPAAVGKEHNPSAILQGHTDMVCEKNADVIHDFMQDGLNLKLNGDILTADKTTLGADNGVAVAMMLAILSDNTLSHPPLECVFTVQEETGLTGATMLDAAWLTGRTMINLDSEEEGIATVSCSGGMTIRLSRNVTRTNANGNAVKITVSGLSGGHSGMNICEDRANANRIMGRILNHLRDRGISFCIADIDGGNKDNAIPRECRCTIVTNALDEAINLTKQFSEQIKTEIVGTDADFILTAVPSTAEHCFSLTDTTATVDLLMLAPNGVRYRDSAAGGFVVSSVNLASIHCDNDGVNVTLSVRSSVESLGDLTKSEITLLAKLLGFESTLHSQYPGWTYARESKLRDVFCECHQELTGKQLKLEALHAGLECGIFAQKLPGLDAVAIGPNIRGCHTPEESLDLRSCERVYQLILAVLERL